MPERSGTRSGTTRPGTTRETDGRRRAAAVRRRAREAEIIAATREVIDGAGLTDMRIETIASAVGINRAIVYRHFSGKDELVALTLVTYLDELRDRLRAAVGDPALADDAAERLTALVGAFVDFGLAHRAFVDCAQGLMSRRGDELLDEIAESALFRLGRAISGCLTVLVETIESGRAAGTFTGTDDPTLLANLLYATGLGALQLARVGILVEEAAPGVPTVAELSVEEVRRHLVTTALVLAGAPTR